MWVDGDCYPAAPSLLWEAGGVAMLRFQEASSCWLPAAPGNARVFERVWDSRLSLSGAILDEELSVSFGRADFKRNISSFHCSLSSKHRLGAHLHAALAFGEQQIWARLQAEKGLELARSCLEGRWPPMGMAPSS